MTATMQWPTAPGVLYTGFQTLRFGTGARNLRIVAKIIFLMGSLFPVVGLGQSWPVGSFSATRVEFDTVQPKKIKRLSKVYMSKTGLREEEQDLRRLGEAHFAMVVNFKNNKSWYVIPKQKMYVEMPSANATNVTTEDEPGTVLSPAPCEGYSVAERGKEVVYEERRTQTWVCQTDTKGDVTQLFDPVLRIVVRHQDAKGHVTELRNIKEQAQPDELFSVPKEFRQSTMQEMATGIADLPKFTEPPAEKK